MDIGRASRPLIGRPTTAITAVQVRPAVQADVPAVLEICNHAVLHTTASYGLEPQALEVRLAWYDARMQEGWPVLVAEQSGENGGGRVVGWSTYGRFRERLGFERAAHFRQGGRRFGRWLDPVLLQLMLEQAE